MKTLWTRTFEAGRWDVTVALEVKAADAWVGGFARKATGVEDECFDLWVCLVPFLPVHVTVEAWAEKNPRLTAQEAVSRLRGTWAAWWAPMDLSGPWTKPWRPTPLEALRNIGRTLNEGLTTVFALLQMPSTRAAVEMAVHVEQVKNHAFALGMDQTRIDAILLEAAERAKTSTLSTRSIFDAVWERERTAWTMGLLRSPRVIP